MWFMVYVLNLKATKCPKHQISSSPKQLFHDFLPKYSLLTTMNYYVMSFLNQI